MDDVDVKEAQLEISELDEEDYRGLLAVIITGGSFALVALALIYRPEYLTDIMTGVVGLVSMVVAWYFKLKGK